jgi:hypothetical protein
VEAAMKIVRNILIILLTFHFSGAFAAIETCLCNSTVQVQDYSQCCTKENQPTKKSTHNPVSEKSDDMCDFTLYSEPENYSRSIESSCCESSDNYLCTITTNDSDEKINVPSVHLKYSTRPSGKNQFFSINFEIPFWNNFYHDPSTVSRVYLRISSLLI